MFKKYFAHEFKSSYKLPMIATFIYLGLIILLVVFKFLLPNLWLSQIFSLGAMIGPVGLFVILLITIIKTFIQRLFFQNGYLTLTIPVKTSTILVSKLLVCFIWTIIMVTISALFYIFFSFITIYETYSSGEIMVYMAKIYQSLFSGANFLITIISYVKIMLLVILILICFLFVNAFNHMGLNKALTIFSSIGILIFVVITCIGVHIIPINLYYNFDTSKFLLMQSDMLYSYEIATETYNVSEVLDFSSFFWLILYIVVGYSVSLYIVKNKLDM